MKCPEMMNKSTENGRANAEIGTDMTHFKTAEHICSWAGLCPGIVGAMTYTKSAIAPTLYLINPTP